METVVVNLAGKVRRVVEGGKEYLVADATLICPGVLNGSKGPLYYPPDEVAKTAAAWNGMPLVVYHPTDPISGQHLSARDHGVLERQGIGNVRSPVVVADGKLRAKLWFDADRTRAVDSRVYDALVKGQAVELSTGLFTTNMPAEVGAHHKGQPYSHVATAYVPDHLAILPDQIGACSINDGCGVLVNAAQTKGVVARFWDWLTGNAGANQPRHGDTGQFLPTGAGTGKGPAHAAAKEGHAHTGFTDPEKDKPGGDDDDADSGMKTKGGKGGGKGNKIVGLDDNGNPITNANPEGHNQYTGGTGSRKEQHAAAVQSVHDHASSGGSDMEQKLVSVHWDHPAIEKVHTALSDGQQSQFTVRAGSGPLAYERTYDKSLADRKREFTKLDRVTTKAIEQYGKADLEKDSSEEADRGKVLGVLRQVKLHAARGLAKIDDAKNLKKPTANDGSTPEQSAPATVTTGQGVKPPKPPKPIKAALSGSAEAQTRKEQGADALSAAPGTRNAGEPMDPHEATLAAVGATHKAGGQRAQNNALTALGHSNNDNPDAAAGSHEKAAVAHEKMATKSRMAGDHDDAEDHDQAAALHRKAASCHRAGSMAENSYTRNGATGDAQHDAMMASLREKGKLGKSAEAASHHAEADSISAEIGGKDEHHERAAKSHLKAAKAHEKAGNTKEAEGHRQSAQHHANRADSVSLHNPDSVSLNRRATRNAFDSDEQRKAFFGLLAAHKGSEGEKKTNAATEASDKATSIASPVGGGKKAEAEHKGKVRAAHDEAAEAHDEAAVHHEKNGNKELASLHRETAKHHRSEASTNNRAGTMNRAAVIDHLIVNGCACEADRVALNALSDRVLNAFKKKADDDDDDEDEEDDDDEDDRGPRRNDGTDIHSFDGKGTKSGGSQQSGGKGTKEEYAENRWLQSAPPGIQRMVANYKAAENRERLNLVNQLIANVDDDARRKAIANRLLRKDVDELRDLVAIMGPRVGPEPSLSALYLGSAAPIGNADQQAADQNDILPLPTLNWEEVSREHRSKKA